jgi:hypothetical protein
MITSDLQFAEAGFDPKARERVLFCIDTQYAVNISRFAGRRGDIQDSTLLLLPGCRMKVGSVESITSDDGTIMFLCSRSKGFVDTDID